MSMLLIIKPHFECRNITYLKYAFENYGAFASIFLKCYFFSLRNNYFPRKGSVYFMLISMLVYCMYESVIDTKVKLASNAESLHTSQ